MNTISILGFVAAGMTTLSFLVQALRILKHRSTKDISLGMYLMFCFGVGLWLIYGILLHAWPIIIANAITLALAGAVLAMKMKFG